MCEPEKQGQKSARTDTVELLPRKPEPRAKNTTSTATRTTPNTLLSAPNRTPTIPLEAMHKRCSCSHTPDKATDALPRPRLVKNTRAPPPILYPPQPSNLVTSTRPVRPTSSIMGTIFRFWPTFFYLPTDRYLLWTPCMR